jgi:hypothetical protein
VVFLLLSLSFSKKDNHSRLLCLFHFNISLSASPRLGIEDCKISQSSSDAQRVGWFMWPRNKGLSPTGTAGESMGPARPSGATRDGRSQLSLASRCIRPRLVHREMHDSWPVNKHRIHIRISANW